MEILNPIDYLKLKFISFSIHRYSFRRRKLIIPSVGELKCIPCAFFTVQSETYKSVSKKEDENEKKKKKLQTV
jgi:hypothetical protein